MSIFNVDWRGVFNIALPPIERVQQTLDLGEALLVTLKSDSDDISDLLDQTNAEVTNACITMVLRALLNRMFEETTFEVETTRGAIQVYLFDQSENQPVYFNDISEGLPVYLADESEGPLPNASITVRVPASVYSTQLNQVNEFVKIRKVAGKSYEIVSL